MFELSIIRKYLIPRKRHLSVALIASMSTAVIALVVWLLLVFLSVTDGIEKSWLEKLTSLSAPLRITPTRAYYSSYYYLADQASASSNFTEKSIGQKASAPQSDPYDPAVDAALPTHWPSADLQDDGSLKDPVKTAFAILSGLQKTTPGLCFQEFEISGALLRLQLVRSDSQSFLTQVSYLASFADQSPYVTSLIAPPTAQDLNHLLAHSDQIHNLASHIEIQKMKSTSENWRVAPALLAENVPFEAYAYVKGETIAHIMIPQKKGLHQGTLVRRGGTLFFNDAPVRAPLFAEGGFSCAARLVPASIAAAKKVGDLQLSIQGILQGKPVAGIVSWDGLEIEDASAKTSFAEKPLPPPLWPHKIGTKIVLPNLNERGILLAQSFRDGGVRLGDRGYIAYQAATTGSFQEQRIAVYVSGFYDPGVMSIGPKCVLVPGSLARTINAASHMQHFDKTASNGIQIWCRDLKQTEAIRNTLQQAFEKAGIDKYWSLATYHDYDFAKDLLQQFASDRTLFTLIGIIILIVACCNIISLLVILVHDKKREIGILQAMGASRRSIALIFGGLGAAMGIASSILGVGAALLTLYNLDSLVGLLSFVQGRDAFNAVFYGRSLPNALSYDALLFIVIATPILSLLAGLVPAIQACRLRPSAILRSE